MKLRARKTISGLAGAFALLPLLDHSADACSRVMWKTEKQGVFAARSMDWNELIEPRLALNPRGLKMDGGVNHPETWSSRFGSVVVLGANYGNAVMDGMNEKGLTGHVLYLHATKYEKRREKPGVSYVAVLRYILDNSATVNEALKSLNIVQIVPVPVRGKIFGIHIAMEDPTGDSAIIEFIRGRMIVHHGARYAVMTNDPPYAVAMKALRRYQSFGGDTPIPGNIESMDRFVRAAYFLKYLPQPKDSEQGVAYVFQIIHNVAAPVGAPYKGGLGETYPTWWITAADLTNQIYYFNMTENPNVTWVNLKALNFSSSHPALMLDPNNPALAGDVGRAFKPVASTQPDAGSAPGSRRPD